MRQTLLKLGAVAMVALGVVACSGDDGAQGPAGPAGPPGATGPTGPTGPGVTPPTGSATGSLTGTINSVTIDSAAGQKVTVTFTLKDADGNLVAGAQDKNFEFQLAKLIPATSTKPTNWQSYINRSDQEGGAKTFTGGAERGKPVAVAGQSGVYSYTFCTPLASVASFLYYGSGTEPAGSCDSTAVANAGVLSSAAWNAVRPTLNLAYDAAATTRLAILGRDGALVNIVQDFVPTQLPTLLTAIANQVVTDQSCGACHADRVADRGRLHFGSGGHFTRRFVVEVCSSCHNANSFNPAASTDTAWVSLDLGTMMHEYHADSANGFPQNAPFGGTSAIGTGFNNNVAVAGVINCRSCHDNQNPKILPQQPTNRADANKMAWRTQISQQACNSCHNVDYTAHFGNQPGNAQCANCHGVDASVAVNVVHATPYSTPNNPELYRDLNNASIVAKKVEYQIASVTVDSATNRPAVKFRVLVDGTPLNLKTLPSGGISIGGLNMKLAWAAPMGAPTSEANGPAIPQPVDWNNFGTTSGRQYWNNAVSLGTGFSAYDQPTTVNFSTAGVIASLTGPDAEGYFTTVAGINPATPLAFPATTTLRGVAMESYLTINSMNISGNAALKGVDGSNTLRREIVDIDSCNTCHERVGFHSNAGRMNSPQYCATCHNPEVSSSNVFEGFATFALAPGAATFYYSQQPNNFKEMLHAIHAGQARKNNPPTEKPFNFIRGNPNASGGSGPMVFQDIVFPARVQDCASCHKAGTYNAVDNPNFAWTVTNAQPALGTATTFDPLASVRQGPSTGACGSCHNSASAAAHFATQTAARGETCVLCHGPGRVNDPAAAHAAR